MKKNIWWILLGILAVQIFLLVKLKFTAWPEMLLWPNLITKGWLPYRDIAIAHTPLMLSFLSIFFKIAGTGIVQLKLFTWGLILITDLLVFWLSAKIWNRKVALFSLIAFIFWSLFYDGNGLWFDLMLAPLALVTFYLLNKKNWFWAGAIWGIMFFTKQTAFWFLIPIGFDLLRQPLRSNPLKRTIKQFIAGLLTFLPVALGAIYIFKVLPDFFYWAIKYGIFILPRSSGQIQFPDLRTLLVAVLPFAIIVPFYLKKKSKSLNLVLWGFAGILGAYPRFEFFHFQPSIPFLAIASALAFSEFKKDKGFIKTFLTLYLIGSIFLFSNFLLRDWGEGVRFFETNVQDIVSYVKANTKPDEKIFVMNWWDSIYALSGTLPAVRPWVPQLPWYQDLPGIQEKEVADLMNAKPKMILLNSYTDAGLSGYIPKKVFDYVEANYTIKQKIDGIEILVPKKDSI